MIFVFYLCIGAIAGLLAGLFGIGGGIIVVPLLVTIFQYHHFPPEVLMHFAAGTSLAVMVITTSSSLRAHIKLGHDVWPVFKKLLPGLIIGAILGAVAADFLHSQALELIFGLLLLGVAVRSFFVRDPSASEKAPATWLLTLASLVSGSASGLLGIGGSTIIVPFLLHMKIGIRLSVAIAAACSATVAVIGAVMYMITGANETYAIGWTTGYIYWPAFFGIAIASPIFATIGAKLSSKIPVLFLRRLFVVIILLAALKLLVF